MRELAREIDHVAKANNELAEQAEKANNAIDEDLSQVQVAALDAVDSMYDSFDEFFKFGEEGFLDLGRLAESVMDDIAEAAYRNMIINPLLGAVTSAITGGGGASAGGSSTIGTGSNNSLGTVNRGFSGGAGGGSPVLTPASGGTTVVQLTINAVDAPGVQQLLLANKGLITGLVQENYTRRGVAGPRGVR
ncbi:MAG: hypothetical protein C0405_15135 [Desulfovibrio sp.]|nr:hypothetical protein [Desulfovibrio sp.]